MSNTIIQIKRSSSTAVPTNGSLAAAELAYSYNSDRLFIGNADGTGVVEIGGEYWLDHINRAFETANSGGGGANSAFDNANAAYSYANTTYQYATDIAAGANAWASSVGAAANAYTLATYVAKSGDTVSGDLSITGNLTVSGVTTYASSQTLLIGDALITLNADLPVGVAPTENAGMEVNRGSAQANSALFWNESVDKWQVSSNVASSATYKNIAISDDVDGANTYSVAIGAASNAYSVFIGASANAWANTVGVAGNNYTNSVNTRIFQTFSDAANLISGTIASARLSGSYTGITGVGTITAGVWNGSTVDVPYGGTGVTSFTTNGILFGNNSGSLQITSAGSEGQVLQASSTGVPLFAMLDGGSF